MTTPQRDGREEVRDVFHMVLRRLLLAVPTLLGVTVVVFLTIEMIPGDPAVTLAGPVASQETVAAIRDDLGLARALPVRYVSWLGQLARGDLGDSIARPEPVRGLLATPLLNSVILAGTAWALATVGGIALGTVGAFRADLLSGRITGWVSTVAVSAPQYTVALLLLTGFALQWEWFPTGGIHDSVGSQGVPDLLRHLVLPASAAAITPMGITARVFRASLLDVVHHDFVDNLRARGLRPARVALHAVHNALPPLLTVTGLQLGYLLGGIVFIETIFAWPGLGSLVFDAVGARDLPVILGGVLATAVSFVGLNLLVDVVHALLDPRIR